MALGATARRVQWMVLRESLGMIGAGAAVGIVGALIAGRLLLRVVEGIEPGGALTYVVTLSVLIVAALVAGFVPARRASRIDPMRALRQD